MTASGGRPTAGPVRIDARDALRSAATDTAGSDGASHASEAYVRRMGRPLVYALYGALRAIKLYPLENAAVQKALEELTNVAESLRTQERELELRVTPEFLFINSTRLRLDLDNYASFGYLRTLCQACGVGIIHLGGAAVPRDWMVALSLMQAPSASTGDERRAELEAKLAAAGVLVFEFGPPSDADEAPDVEQAKQAAKRTYAQSVAATKDVMNSVRMGKNASIRKIKRVVQGIVDQILNEETSLIGLTTIRDYDEYTFTHSVNVCIFSVALGRRLGLTKMQLYDLGLAALFHDIGKSRVAVEVLNKTTALSDDDWRMIAGHPWLGVLALFQMRGQQELPLRPMVVAYEHHMKTDLTGYPRSVRARRMSIYSKIVAVADGFDAATSRRAYQAEPMSPAAVLQEMRDNPLRGMDPVIVKAFINMTGLYPVGTLVVLDTFELGIVHAVNPVPEMISRPIVRIVSDAMGNVQHPGSLVDLAVQDDAGAFTRTIIKTENPDRYGIRIGDYFV